MNTGSSSSHFSSMPDVAHYSKKGFMSFSNKEKEKEGATAGSSKKKLPHKYRNGLYEDILLPDQLKKSRMTSEDEGMLSVLLLINSY